MQIACTSTDVELTAMGHNENDENKIVAEGETERENSEQTLETIFYLNTFTSQSYLEVVGN